MKTPQPQLETRRLILRQFEFPDAGKIQALAGDHEVAGTTYSIPHPYTLENARSWIATQKNGWDDRSDISFGLFIRESQELIGCTSLQNIFNDEAQLGYWTGRPYWNNGYCTEATSALIEFAHANLGISRIHAEHRHDNPASGAVLEKLGLTPVKTTMKPDRSNHETPVKIYRMDFMP